MANKMLNNTYQKANHSPLLDMKTINQQIYKIKDAGYHKVIVCSEIASI
jgi:hypothetical protein